MTDLVPVSSFDSVVQHPTTQLLLAGPGGPLNAQAQSLLNRTQFLKDGLDLAALFNTDLGDPASPTKGSAKVARSFQVVNTIAEARLVVKTSASKFVVATGYYAGGDGILSVYRINQSDQTDNGGSILALAGGGSLDIVHNGYMTTRQWGCKADGVTVDGPQIRKALATTIPLEVSSGVHIVEPDVASAFDDGGNTRYAWSIKIPSNRIIRFEQGGVIKQANGVQSWTRTISTQGNSNITIFGEMRVDGNVANRGTPTNEHNHGIFIFDSTDITIERIISQNCRGDNLFIGGTSESQVSSRINIGSIANKTAGRKNLVLQHFNDVNIAVADLDNSAGGASLFGGVADDTDRHCLDVEPDAFTGAFRHEAWIGRLRTFGLGNDFTAGITTAVADACVLNIDTAECVQSASSATVAAWIQNAMTVNVKTLSVIGCAGMDVSFRINYGARLTGDTIKISGASLTSTGFLAQIAMVGADADKPYVSFSKAEIVNTVGGGWDIRTSNTEFGVCRVKCVFYGIQTAENAALTSNRGNLTIGTLISQDTGVPTTGAVLHASTISIAGFETTIQKAIQYDSRGTKAGFFARIQAGNAQGVTIGCLVSPESIPPVDWISTDKFYRISGGRWTNAASGAPAVFVCFGTPEGMIPANIGCTAMRLDGGALTSFYVKQTGTGNTGWAAK